MIFKWAVTIVTFAAAAIAFGENRCNTSTDKRVCDMSESLRVTGAGHMGLGCSIWIINGSMDADNRQLVCLPQPCYILKNKDIKMSPRETAKHKYCARFTNFSNDFHVMCAQGLFSNR